MVKLEIILVCDGPPWMLIIFVFNSICQSWFVRSSRMDVVGGIHNSTFFPKENAEQTFQYDQKSQTGKFQEGKV